MRTLTANWFETKVKYEKTMEDGTQKQVTELYCVDAFSFTEAESAIMKEMSSYISGTFEVTDIKKASYKEIVFSDNNNDDKWYKAKVQFIIIDEEKLKEKRSNVYYLIQSNTLSNAVKQIEQFMGGMMQDYNIAAVNETLMMDVFEHTPQTTGNNKEDKEE